MVSRFEDLECWQLARQLTINIYHLSQHSLAKEFEIKGQICRASLSIMNNVAEGFTRKSPKEFIRFLDIASGSCAEVKSMIYLITDLGFFTEAKNMELLEQTSKTQAKILALVRYLSSKSTN